MGMNRGYHGSSFVVIREPGDPGQTTRVGPSEDRLHEEPDRTEAPSVEQGIPMEEVPKINRREGIRAQDVPRATSTPGGGDSGVVIALVIYEDGSKHDCVMLGWINPPVKHLKAWGGKKMSKQCSSSEITNRTFFQIEVHLVVGIEVNSSSEN
ncbi:hypothetical protein ACLOJK_025002 [Asimina triloba]